MPFLGVTLPTSCTAILHRHQRGLQGVNFIKSKVVAFTRSMSLPYPGPGIRLIRQDKIDQFTAKMVEFQEELVEAVENLDRHYSDLKVTARQRLGSLYNSGDYPETLIGAFSIDADFPSVKPPDYLQQLNPRLYEQECQQLWLGCHWLTPTY